MSTDPESPEMQEHRALLERQAARRRQQALLRKSRLSPNASTLRPLENTDVFFEDEFDATPG